MPLVKLSVIGSRTANEKLALMDAVHSALVDAFGIPESDHNIRLNQYAPGDWLLPPGKSDRYVLVEIFAFAGRGPEAKGNLYKRIADNMEALGVPRQDVFIILIDAPRENWGIRGGQRADQVDLGYQVKV